MELSLVERLKIWLCKTASVAVEAKESTST
jgi:hypothetical protein